MNDGFYLQIFWQISARFLLGLFFKVECDIISLIKKVTVCGKSFIEFNFY